MEKLKIYYINRKVVFPGCTLNVVVAMSESSKNLQVGERIAAYPIRNFFDIFFYRNNIAAISEISSIDAEGSVIKLQIKGIQRAHIKKIYNYKQADCEIISNAPGDEEDISREELRKKSQELIFLINIDESDRLINLLNYLIDLNQLSDFISNYFIMDFKRRYRLFRELNPVKRSNMLIKVIDELIKKISSGKKALL